MNSASLDRRTSADTQPLQRKSLSNGDEVREQSIAGNCPKCLSHLILDAFLENWCDNPIYDELPENKDRLYILQNLNVNLPLKILISCIREDIFWRRCYQHRWRTLYYEIYTYQPFPMAPPARATLANPSPRKKREQTKPWLNIYMERHLQEMIENLPTAEYEQDAIQETLDICAPYINQLEINQLQPSVDGMNDHIPLDFILSNLPELHTLRLTYCAKNIGTSFYLGCNTLSRRDVTLLARGLSQCYELVHFCLHNTALEPYQLGLFAHSLDKGCHRLATLSLEHCSVGDKGIREFVSACNKESFGALRYLDLTNNKITSEGAFVISRAIKTIPLEKLSLRLNPVGSDGAAAIFGVLSYLPLRTLDLSGCSVDESITKLFMQLIIQNRTLWYLELANNNLGEDFGKHLYKIIGFNQHLRDMDLRNNGISLSIYNKLRQILKQNLVNSLTNGNELS